MYLIQSQLAPTSATVEESMYLTDEAIDSDREIDIFISDPTGGLPPQTVAIECRDRQRKADVEWIDAIIGKYSKIRVRRVVAISRSGFTKNAIKKAKDANIDALSLDQALEADWETAVNNVVAAMLRSHLVTRMRSELHFTDTSEPVLLDEHSEFLRAVIYEANGSFLGLVGHFMNWLFEGPQMQELLAAYAIHLTEEEPYLFCELTHEFPPGAYLVTSSGHMRPLREAMVLARCRTEHLEIVLEHGSLGQARVAFGSADTFGYRVHTAASQVPEGPLNAGVLVRAPKGKGQQPKHQQGMMLSRVDRNDPCPCGSGKKFKRCHGNPI